MINEMEAPKRVMTSQEEILLQTGYYDLWVFTREAIANLTLETWEKE